jgi:hypothetical protein
MVKPHFSQRLPASGKTAEQLGHRRSEAVILLVYGFAGLSQPNGNRYGAFEPGQSRTKFGSGQRPKSRSRLAATQSA